MAVSTIKICPTSIYYNYDYVSIHNSLSGKKQLYAVNKYTYAINITSKEFYIKKYVRKFYIIYHILIYHNLIYHIFVLKLIMFQNINHIIKYI